MIFSTSYLSTVISILSSTSRSRTGLPVAEAGEYQTSLGPPAAGDSPGCGLPYTRYRDGESRNFSIPIGEGIRNFSIHLPTTYEPTHAYPLMISYHGGTETKEEQERVSRFSHSSVNPQMVVVYPQGINVRNGPAFSFHFAHASAP